LCLPRQLLPSVPLSTALETRQSQTADSAPCAATWEVSLSARKVAPCARWLATGITAHSLEPSPRLRMHCASAGRRRRATLAYDGVIHKTRAVFKGGYGFSPPPKEENEKKMFWQCKKSTPSEMRALTRSMFALL